MVLTQEEKCATCGRPLPVDDPNDVFTQDDEWKADLLALLSGEVFDTVCPEIEARIAKAARTGR